MNGNYCIQISWQNENSDNVIVEKDDTGKCYLIYGANVRTEIGEECFRSCLSIIEDSVKAAAEAIEALVTPSDK